MSESPVYVPPFVPASRDLDVPLRAARAAADELDDDVDAQSDAEGHTHPDGAGSDEGDRRPGAHVAPPPVTAAPNPADIVDRPGTLASAAVSLAGAFDAIQAALRDLPTRGRPLRDRVALELARVEATRGRWLADAAAVMQREPLAALDEVDQVRVLRAVVEASGPESRLSGGAVALPVSAGTCPVFGDERKLAVVLAPRQEPATRTLEIAQSAVRVPVSAFARFFDAGWREHPAGATGALMFAAARRIAVAHGGALEIDAIDGGCRLRFSVPTAD